MIFVEYTDRVGNRNVFLKTILFNNFFCIEKDVNDKPSLTSVES